MKSSRMFQRVTAIAAIAAAAAMIAGIPLALAAINFNPAMFNTPLGMLDIGPSHAALLGWSMVTDFLGSYVLWIPMILYLWHWLRPKNPGLVDLYSVSGLCYSLFGAIAAAFLWAAWPALINAYGSASGAERASVVVIYDAITAGMQMGLFVWEFFFIGVWWLGIGLLLRSEYRAIGSFTVGLGILALMAMGGIVMHVTSLDALAALLSGLLQPIWLVLLAIIVLRRTPAVG